MARRNAAKAAGNRANGHVASPSEQRKTFSSVRTAAQSHMCWCIAAVLGACLALLAATPGFAEIRLRLFPPTLSDSELVALEASLESARKLQKRDPHAAVAQLEELVATSRVGRGTLPHAEVLEALGDAYVALKHPDAALGHHREALRIRKSHAAEPARLAVSYSSLAEDYRLGLRTGEALKQLHLAQGLSGLPPGALSVLLQQEADVHDCIGDAISALHRFEHGINLAPRTDAKGAIRHLQLLLGAIRTVGRSMPEHVRASMKKKARTLSTGIISRGPWVRADQLPGTFIPGIGTSPFHDVDAGGAFERVPPWMSAAAAKVRAAAPSLLAEYDELRSQQQLRTETECIHSHDGGGVWKRFEVTGIWEELGEDGCAAASPVACALYHSLRSEGMPLIRVGYSEVGADTWLRPHCGMTNAQLKWHLGLRVPAAGSGRKIPGTPGCTAMRVANETRTWEEGGLLFFDDSFEHEVWNLCTAARVVLQLVFVHPDLADQQDIAAAMAAAAH